MTLVSERTVVILKVVLYGGLFFFSFFVFIAVPVTTGKVRGCLLYPDILTKRSYIPGSSSNCNYAVAMSVVQLLYGLFRLVTLLLLIVGKIASSSWLFKDLLQLIYTVMDVLACFLVFVSACILSAGIASVCGQLDDYSIACNNYHFNGDSHAVSRMRVAEVGAWISFTLWLVMAVVGALWLYRQGRLPCFSQPTPPAEAKSEETSGKGP